MNPLLMFITLTVVRNVCLQDIFELNFSVNAVNISCILGEIIMTIIMTMAMTATVMTITIIMNMIIMIVMNQMILMRKSGKCGVFTMYIIFLHLVYNLL